MRNPGALLTLLLAVGAVAWAQQPAAQPATQPAVPAAMAHMNMAHMAMVSQVQEPKGSPSAGPQEAPVVREGDTPAYHRSLPKDGMKGLPPTLDPKMFNDPRVQAAYAMASKVRAVLYQQPCYCHCDNEVGHHSLLDCFAGEHASICQTCMMEGVYAYQQAKAGKSAAAIRAAIERGAWKTINLNNLLLGVQVY
jgi:hypothetical protein